MRCLVTGGAGFIGFHLCRALLLRGIEVTVLDDLSNEYDPGLKEENLWDLAAAGGVNFVRGSVEDHADCCRALAGVQGVFHLAALAGVRESFLRPERTAEVNARGTAALLSAMGQKGVRRCVLASSSTVYGDAAPPFREDAPLGRAQSPYAQSKQTAEMLSTAHCASFPCAVAAARLFSVYGPRMRPALALRKFALQLLNGEEIALYGDCARDFTEVRDAVAGLLACFDHTASHGGFAAFNIAAGRAVKMTELVALLERELGRKAQVRQEGAKKGDAPVTLADLTKSKALLGYEPQVRFEEGAASFCRWLVG